MTRNELERFLAKIDMHGPEIRPGLGPCWLWTAFKHKGYGRFRIGERAHRAHRLAYEHFIGPIPEGLELLHACDVESCVNPAHLSPGTAKDNSADKVARGRSLRGERCGFAELSEPDVIQIIAMRSRGIRRAAVAAAFGISEKQVSRITNGRSWRHLHAAQEPESGHESGTRKKAAAPKPKPRSRRSA